jgi:hypothetical protein
MLEENEDEQLRYETEMGQIALGHAIHGVTSSIEILTIAVSAHRQHIGEVERQFIREARIALDAILQEI